MKLYFSEHFKELTSHDDFEQLSSSQKWKFSELGEIPLVRGEKEQNAPRITILVNKTLFDFTLTYFVLDEHDTKISAYDNYLDAHNEFMIKMLDYKEAVNKRAWLEENYLKMRI